MDIDDIRKVAKRSGLRPEICEELINSGWMFLASDTGETSIWVAPTAELPDYVPHEEPNCDSSCGNVAPHKHGFACFVSCEACQAVCHPDCPAYKEGK